MEKQYKLDFRVDTSLTCLDDLALELQRNERMGNEGDWFSTFREARFGFNSRLYGVREHYEAVHTWLPKKRMPNDHEYQVTSVFFNMDSALECFVFMLNAFGFGCNRNEFRNVTDEKELRQVIITDITGVPTRNIEPVSGYASIFPTVQRLWQNKFDLIKRIQEQHDVSKHRKAIFSGGRCRTEDAPSGFYEKLGINKDSGEVSMYWPMKEIKLYPKPKVPYVGRPSIPSGSFLTLESLMPGFVQFINNSAATAFKDGASFKPNS